MEKQLYLNSFFSASISIFVPVFIWGNTVSHFPWIIEKLDFSNRTIGFLLMYFSIVQLIASQMAGRIIVPKIGTRNTLVIGTLIFSFSPITFGLSNNELNEPEFSSIESSLSNNMSLTSLDLRNNRVSKESDALDRISMIVRKNELDSRK